MENRHLTNLKEVIIPPIILANNWDQFGSRACAILVANLLAKKLNCDFKFQWEMDSRSPGIEERIEFFSIKFQSENRIFKLDSNLEIGYINPKSHTLEEARAIVDSVESNMVLKIEDFLNPPNFSDEDEEKVLLELRNTVLENMDSKFVKAFNLFESFHSNTVAIHGRFGDLLNGRFSQHVPLDKYVDTLTYRYYINQKKNNKKLVFLTDSKLVRDGLENLTDTQLGIDYNSYPNNNLQEHWVDLFTLAASKTIVANYGSGFSVFASMIKGSPIEIITAPGKALLNYDLDNHYSHFKADIRNQLQSRDIVNILQKNFHVFKPSLTFKLIEIAYRCDPDYVMASCFYSISQYLSGNKQLAQQILAQAEAQSRKVLNVHPDPLLITLLVKYCLNSIEVSEIDQKNLDVLMNLLPYQIPYDKFQLFLSSWNGESTKNPFRWPSTLQRLISNIEIFFNHIISVIRFSNRFYQSEVQKNDDTDLLFSLLSLLKNSFVK